MRNFGLIRTLLDERAHINYIKELFAKINVKDLLCWLLCHCLSSVVDYRSEAKENCWWDA